MKAKKAVKRLNKVEALLSNIIDQFPASKQEFGELLDSAKAAVIRARETVNSQLSTVLPKKLRQKLKSRSNRVWRQTASKRLPSPR